MAKSNNNSFVKSDNELIKLLKIVIIITAIFGAFYLLTIFLNKEEEKEVIEEKNEIQYDEILIGNILTQPNDEYFVLIYDIEDINFGLYDVYINQYKNIKDSLRFYEAVINNPLNASYIGENNFKITNIKDFRVNETTLLQIKNKKIKKYYIGDNIKKTLSELVKTEKK